MASDKDRFRVLREFRALLSLTTILPSGVFSLEEAARGFYMINIIGLLEGVMITLILYMLKTYVPDLLLSSLYVMFHIMLTGGIHLDGFADYSDVIGSRARGLKAIEILKDPRKGSFAIIMLGINMFLSQSSMYIILSSDFFLTIYPKLIFLYVLSAESMYIVSLLGREEPYQGLGRLFISYSKEKINIFKNLLLMFIITLSMIFMSSHKMLVLNSIILSVLISYIIYIDADRRLGFVNGDVLGFSYETVRISNLVLISVLCRYI